jgi:hypothetical protein
MRHFMKPAYLEAGHNSMSDDVSNGFYGPDAQGTGVYRPS